MDELNQKLAVQKVVLAEKSAACEALLEEIATNTTIGECGASSRGRGLPQVGQGDIPEKLLVSPLFFCAR